MIRVDLAWLAVEPLGMRASLEIALARAVYVLGAAATEFSDIPIGDGRERLDLADSGSYRVRRQIIFAS